MKLENFLQAEKIVKEIEELTGKLESLNSPNLTIIINESGENGRLMTVGCGKTYPHEFSCYAVTFIETIKADIQSKINLALAQLDPL